MPDDIVRIKIARYLGISEQNSFSLLESVGGECAGALSLYPEDITPSEVKNHDQKPITDGQLKDILCLLDERPLLAGEKDLRLSLAGAQEKIALQVIDNQYFLPVNGSPSTHILKPMIKGINESVYNEFFCMRLAQLLSFSVPNVDVGMAQDLPYFIVERYDRVIDKNTIQRLHQEDFCQALSVMPQMKYEREGGPNINQCMNVIREKFNAPAKDLIDFQKRLIFNYLIGNADAHGKNFSILYREKNQPELAPIYDVLSTDCYENLSKKMAMKIGGQYNPNYITLKNWYSLIPDTKLAQNSFKKTLLNFAEGTLRTAIDLKEKLKNQGYKSSIYDQIIRVISKRKQIILEGYGG